MQLKRYLERLLHQCSEHSFGQDAIEHAIMLGHVTLSFDFDADVRLIMGQYDAICTSYHAHQRQVNELLAEVHAPLLAEILRPQTLAPA